MRAKLPVRGVHYGCQSAILLIFVVSVYLIIVLEQAYVLLGGWRATKYALMRFHEESLAVT